MDKPWKTVVLAVTVTLAALGTVIAFTNLPVVTGCSFYNQCDTKRIGDLDE